MHSFSSNFFYYKITGINSMGNWCRLSHGEHVPSSYQSATKGGSAPQPIAPTGAGPPAAKLTNPKAAAVLLDVAVGLLEAAMAYIQHSHSPAGARRGGTGTPG